MKKMSTTEHSDQELNDMHVLTMSNASGNQSEYGNNISAGISIKDSKFWMDDPCTAFQFFICTVVDGSFCLMGLVLNTISLVVLHKDKNNQVATFLLKSLATADNAVLIISLVILSGIVGPAQIPPTLEKLLIVIPYMKKYLNPFGYITQCCTIWITVLIAINRYIAVCKPFVSDRILTIRKAYMQVAIVVILSVGFNIPRFFQYDIVWKNIKINGHNVTVPKKDITNFGKDKMFELVYFNIFYNFVILIVPLIAIVVFNMFIVVQMRRSRKLIAQISNAKSGSQERDTMTIAMLIIVVELVVCHTADRVITVFRFIAGGDSDCPMPILYASHVANFLIILNSSTDFFIYVIFKRRFRKLFRDNYCCCFQCCYGLDLDRRTSNNDRTELLRSQTTSIIGSSEYNNNNIKNRLDRSFSNASQRQTTNDIEMMQLRNGLQKSNSIS